VITPVLADRAALLIEAARTLCSRLDGLRFAPPVSHVYNPLDYAWAVHAA
jgi:single-strand selective monofunctional uracil DNA glycosylase